MRKLLVVSQLLLSVSAWGASKELSLEVLKMEKRFGIGVSAGGPLSIFGLEIDINVTENFSVGGGFGTGIDYSTAAARVKYYLLGRSVSPYLGFGFARWWTDSVKSRDLAPSFVQNRFLPVDFTPQTGFNLFLAYPSLGVQYLHPLGIEFTAEVMSLFKLFDFANAAYAGLGVHWYF